ncbi:Transcription factor dbaG [Paramyrothecium foliicola]|nr:Transcription factor dbaG [Paramyrothecium foliicola]
MKWECLGYTEETGLMFHYHRTEVISSKAKYRLAPPESLALTHGSLWGQPTDDNLERRALDVFIHDYCLQPADPLLSRGYLQGVLKTIRETGTKSAVSNAARIIALEGIEFRYGRPLLRRKAQWLYQMELRAFQRRMVGQFSSRSVESICVAILFGLYEIISSVQSGDNEHSVHALGITAILRTNNSPFALIKDGPGESNTIQSLPGLFSPPAAGLTASLDELAVTIGKVFERSTKHFDLNQSALHDEAELRRLFSDAEKCFEILIGWDQSQPQAWQPMYIGTATCSQLSGHYGTICWPGKVYVYLDRWVAAIWAIWRKGIVVLAAIAVRCTEILPKCPKLFAIASGMKETASQAVEATFSSIPYFLLNDPRELFREPQEKIEIAPPASLLAMLPTSLAAIGVFSTVALASILASPDPLLLKFNGVSFSGNGCLQGTVSSSFSVDRSHFTTTFDAFKAELGLPNLPVSARSRNCLLHLNLEKPNGWQYAVTGNTWYGHAQLDQGVSASLANTYYFSHAPDGAVSTKFMLSGSEWVSGKNFTIQQTIPEEGLLWSPCNLSGLLNINNRVTLTRSTAEGYGIVGVEEIDNVLQTSIIWRAC